MKYTYYIDRYRWCVAVLPTFELDSGENSLSGEGYATFKKAKSALIRELRHDLKACERWKEDMEDRLEIAMSQSEAEG